MEETGLTTVSLVLDPFSAYFESTYVNPRTGKQKIVVVWAAEVAYDSQVTIQPEEIQAYRWVSLADATTTLSWKEDHEIVARLCVALESLKNQQDGYPTMIMLGDSITQWSWQPGGLAQRLQDWYQRRMDVIVRGFSGYNCGYR